MDVAIQDKEAQAFLSSLAKKVARVKDSGREFVNLLSARVFRDVISHFEKESGPEGPWKEWSPSYRAMMEEIGKGGNKILQDTGNLRQSFVPTNWRKQSDGILWFNPARTKSGFPYARAHNEGGPRLSKREFMWLDKSAVDDMGKITLKFLED